MQRTVLVILLVIGDVASLAGCRRDRGYQGDQHEQKKMALPAPKGTPKRPQGMTALTVKTGGEPFTKEDVVAYFKTHNFPKNLGASNEFTVDTFEFLTSKVVSERLQGVQTGLEGNARVAFVTLTGRFVFTGPPRTPKKEPTIFNRAYAVFDATNGNLMMVGTLDEKKRE